MPCFSRRPEEMHNYGIAAFRPSRRRSLPLTVDAATFTGEFPDEGRHTEWERGSVDRIEGGLVSSTPTARAGRRRGPGRRRGTRPYQGSFKCVG